MQLSWLGLVVVSYGSLDAALNSEQHSPLSQIAFMGYFAGVPASFFGGVLGPFGVSISEASRGRIFWSSACGAGLATGVAVSVALLGSVVVWQLSRESAAKFIWLWLIMGTFVGIGFGWLGGKLAARV